jgi:hypothetical protein
LNHEHSDRRQRLAVEHVLKDRDEGIDVQCAMEVDVAKTKKDADQREANGAGEGSGVDQRGRGRGIHGGQQSPKACALARLHGIGY